MYGKIRLLNRYDFVYHQVKEIKAKEYKQAVSNRTIHCLIGPQNIILQVNYGCYLQCKMCDRHTWTDNHAPVDRVLTIGELNKLFLSLVQMGTKSIILVGTEPVLRPDLHKILSTLKNVGIKSELYTAGIVLKDEVINSVLDNGTDVALSVDGFCAKSHNSIRMPNGKMNAFEKTMSAIKRLALARNTRKLTKNETCITANMTLQTDNISDLSKVTQEQIDSLGVDCLRISLVHGHGSYTLNSKSIPILKEFVQKIEKFKTKTEISLATGLRYITSNQIETKDFDKNILIPSSTANGKKKSVCHIADFSATIDPQGNVYPCLYLYDDNGPYQDNGRQKFVVGNIKDNSFAEIWNGKKYNDFRKSVHPDLSPGSRCLTCEYMEQFDDIETKIAGNGDDLIKAGW